MLESTSLTDSDGLFYRPVPPTYEARANYDTIDGRGRPLQVLAPDGLTLINRRGGVEAMGRGFWNDNGADW